MVSYPEILRKAWPVFLEAVRTRRTITYSELAGRVGPPCTARAIHRQLLNPLSSRCRLWDLPDLPSLVVRKGSGTPGAGWFDPAVPGDPLARWSSAVERCFRHRWPKTPDPRLTIETEDR
jgi:hypothetical protein